MVITILLNNNNKKTQERNLLAFPIDLIKEQDTEYKDGAYSVQVFKLPDLLPGLLPEVYFLPVQARPTDFTLRRHKCFAFVRKVSQI